MEVPQRVTDIQEEIYSLRVRFDRNSAAPRDAHIQAKRRVDAFLGYWNELGDELKKLPDPDRAGQNLVMPETKLVKNESWSTLKVTHLTGDSDDGKIVEVKPLSIKPGSLAGSEASYESQLFKAVKTRGVYVKGHLLGAHVYGPGDSNGGR